jgi:hypothetical protein
LAVVAAADWEQTGWQILVAAARVVLELHQVLL